MSKKLRIIAGFLGGRLISAPHGHKTHPMGEKIRGAIFNALGDISGLSVIDAFSGSGAVALEALSRGAAEVVAIDKDKAAHETIQKNAESLGLKSEITVIRANAVSWYKRHKDKKFDVVILDPPYDQVHYSSLIKLADLAKKDGIIIYSLPPDNGFRLDENLFKLLTNKSYGDATLAFYKAIQ